MVESGKRFGRLVAIEKYPTNKPKPYWRCLCDCGNEKIVSASNLVCGNVKSCGCLRKEQAIERFKNAASNNVKHGKAGTSLYYVWNCMRQRCENPNISTYKWYGGKGIKVCDEWKDFSVFAKWAYDHGYHEIKDVPKGQKMSIDRIDSNSDYCPENCRWITLHENILRATKARWENANRDRG